MCLNNNSIIRPKSYSDHMEWMVEARKVPMFMTRDGSLTETV